MKAHQGDRILPAASQFDRPTREGDVLEVEGEDGKPPYLVRWTKGHLGLLPPGPDRVQQVQRVRRVQAAKPFLSETGDELAVARARRHLADSLLETQRRTSTH